MGLVVSLVLIAAGAIMRFAVTAQASGWNVHTAGMVLMVVGAIGAVLSIVYWGQLGRLRPVPKGRRHAHDRARTRSRTPPLRRIVSA